MQDLRVLGLDPGRINYAYSIIRMESAINSDGVATLRPIVEQTGLLSKPLSKARNASRDLPHFMQEIDSLMTLHDLTVIGMEHFQGRSFSTELIQTVNICYGAMLQRGYSIIAINPATWKNKLKTVCDLKDIHSWITCTEHELDATLIGVYVAFKHLELPPYNLYKRGTITKLARGVCDSSKTPPRKRRRTYDESN